MTNRHTAYSVASTRSAVLSLGWGVGYPSPSWGGVTAVPAGEGGGTPVPDQGKNLRLGTPMGKDQRPGKEPRTGVPPWERTFDQRPGKGPGTRVPLSPRGQTHNCENNTFPILRMRAVINPRSRKDVALHG